MTLNKFTMAGYAHFYRSLLRFNRDIKSGEAAELTYLLYTAVLDSYRYKKPDVQIEEYGPVEFYGNLKRMERRPYRTEIQLYRAAEALLTVITIAALSVAQCEAVLRLCCMMDNIELRFYMAFDCELDDKRTVYRECARSLVPKEGEPGVCLMHDWINLPTA